VAAGATGGVITLKIAPKATGSPGALDKQAADLFNQANPGLKLELDVPPSGNYYEKILTEIAAGEPPDAARIDDYLLAPSVARKGIDPLDSYIGADKSFDLGDFDKVALQNGQYQGKQYGMPIELDTYVIFYNATAFKEAGIPLPPTDWTDNSWTWPDFLQICQKLVKQTGGSTDRWGFMYDYAFVSRLSAEVYAQGGTFVDDPLNPSKLTLDNPRSVAGLQFLSDLRNRYQVAPTQQVLDKGGGSQKMFQQGKMAMYIDGPWSAAGNKPAIQNRFEWDVAPLPHEPNTQPGETAISNCLTILSGGKHKDDAWRVVKHWISPQVQELHAIVPDETPSRRSSLPIINKVPPPPKNMSVFVDGFAHSISIIHTPVYDEMQKEILDALAPVWDGKQTAQDAIVSLTPKINSLLQSK